jgi:putative peptidoglycan lipid II flippase
MTLLSRITGLVRDILIARVFGVSADTDAYYVAFRLPNLLRRLFAEGAFQQAFVPMLAEFKEKKPFGEAKTFIDQVASALAFIVLLVSILGVLAAPVLVWIIASGLSEEPETFATAVELTRYMFPYIFFMSLVAFFSSVLNTWRHFAVPAAVPIFLNLSIITATLFIAPHMQRPIFALAVGVMLGGFLQFSIQIPLLCKLGLMPRLRNPVKSFSEPAVKRVIRLMGPALFAVGVAQISILINTNIATFLQEGSVTWLSYADRLMEFPTALLGVALGTVLLPSLSSAFAKGDLSRYNRLLDWGLKLVVLFAIPAAVGLALTCTGLISVLFQNSRFDAADVHQTATAVLGYSFGLIGLIGIKVLAPAFYAQKDIKTPVKIACVALAGTQLLNLIFVPLFAHAGLACSVGLGACINASLLLATLKRRSFYSPESGWKKIFAATLLGNIVLVLILYALQWNLDWTVMQCGTLSKFALLLGVILCAAAGYLFVLFLFGFRLKDLRADNIE